MVCERSIATIGKVVGKGKRPTAIDSELPDQAHKTQEKEDLRK